MTKSEFAILEVLCNHGSELYGLDIVRLSDKKVRRAGLYAYLNRLEDMGYISSREEDAEVVVPRRMYKVTDQGRKALEPKEISALRSRRTEEMRRGGETKEVGPIRRKTV